MDFTFFLEWLICTLVYQCFWNSAENLLLFHITIISKYFDKLQIKLKGLMTRLKCKCHGNWSRKGVDETQQGRGGATLWN